MLMAVMLRTVVSILKGPTHVAVQEALGRAQEEGLALVSS